jgi:hypothetical protein
MTDIFYQSLKISDEAITQEVAGETVILDMRGENYFGLDVVGTRVWQLIQEKGNLSDAVTVMLEEFDVEESELRADLCSLLNKLIDAGLVSVDG